MQLRYHPMLTQITTEDHFALTSPIDVQALPLDVAQTLLDIFPLLVSPSPDNETQDWQLNPNPTIALLKQHPQADKLMATLHIYPDAMLSDVLIGALMFAPALQYRQQKNCLINLFYRAEQAKALIPASPSKKHLAGWADVNPSAIRKMSKVNKPQQGEP